MVPRAQADSLRRDKEREREMRDSKRKKEKKKKNRGESSYIAYRFRHRPLEPFERSCDRNVFPRTCFTSHESRCVQCQRRLSYLISRSCARARAPIGDSINNEASRDEESRPPNRNDVPEDLVYSQHRRLTNLFTATRPWCVHRRASTRGISSARASRENLVPVNPLSPCARHARKS